MRTLLLVLIGVFVAGCQGGGSPSNVVVQVANERAEQASFSWRSAGLFGNTLLPSTGTDPIAGCGVYGRGFGPGHQEVTVSIGAKSLNLTFEPTSTDQLLRYVVIDDNGAISEVGEATFPTEPCSSGPTSRATVDHLPSAASIPPTAFPTPTPEPSSCCTHGPTALPGGISQQEAVRRALALVPANGSAQPLVVWAAFEFDPFSPANTPNRKPVWTVRVVGAVAAPTCAPGYLNYLPSTSDPLCLDNGNGVDVVLDFYDGSLIGWRH